MAKLNFKSKKTRIVGSAILAVVIVLIVLLVVPTLGGGDFAGLISTGGTTEGGQFGIHFGAYR